MPNRLITTGRLPVAGLMFLCLWLSACRQIPTRPDSASASEVETSALNPAPSPSQAPTPAPVLELSQSPAADAMHPPPAYSFPPKASYPPKPIDRPQGSSYARWLPAQQHPDWLKKCFGVHQLDEAPRIERTRLPDYPQQTSGEMPEGRVTIVIRVSAQGKVDQYLISPDSNPTLAKAAVDALRRWKFSVSRYKGQAVPVCLAQRFNFRTE